MLRLAETADVLLEGFRPGVMERLGLGPDDALARNPRLIYGRMTGFGQDGPLAARAGHDLTYLAYSGVLHAIGSKDGKPVPPLNLVGDYGGGTMFLIMGVLAGLIERARSGKGQVIDAAMIDGASMLAAPFFSFLAMGFWNDRRGVNLLDSGAPFYDSYETGDSKHVAVACLEPQFFAEFARLLPCPKTSCAAQYDRRIWDEMRGAIADRIKEKTRDEWTAVFEATDACVAPVLSLTEAPAHAHNRARQTHVTSNGFERPAPAPRFSRTPAKPSEPCRSTIRRDIIAFRNRKRRGGNPDEIRDYRLTAAKQKFEVLLEKNEPSAEKKKDVIRETDAEAIRLARTLLRSARFGAIAVLDPRAGRRWQAASALQPTSMARR